MTAHCRHLVLLCACLTALAACGGGQDTAAPPDTTAQGTSDPATPTANRQATTAPDTAALKGRPVITAAMVRTVAPPPRPNNGRIEVHPGVRSRDRTTGTGSSDSRSGSAGGNAPGTGSIVMPSTHIPQIGD